MKKQILSVISIVLFVVSIASAQTPSMPTKQITAGVVNGKAINLVKPAYPAAAREAHVEGAVNVQISIDEEGNVVSAEAISGHPLLREAAREAALQSKFKPTFLSGQPVKIMGVLVYNFVADMMPNWFKVGYDLANVQHAPSLRFLNTNAIAKVFQTDWMTEKEQLERLTAIKKAEPSSVSSPIVTSERKISEKTEKKSDGTIIKKVITEQSVKSDNQTDSEQIAISQSLIALLQSRLGSNELNLWEFNTGVSLSRALSKLRYTTERQRVIDVLRQQIQSAPSGVSSEYLGEIQKIVAILEKQNQTAEDRQQVGQILSKLFIKQ